MFLICLLLSVRSFEIDGDGKHLTENDLEEISSSLEGEIDCITLSLLRPTAETIICEQHEHILCPTPTNLVGHNITIIFDDQDAKMSRNTEEWWGWLTTAWNLVASAVCTTLEIGVKVLESSIRTTTVQRDLGSTDSTKESSKNMKYLEITPKGASDLWHSLSANGSISETKIQVLQQTLKNEMNMTCSVPKTIEMIPPDIDEQGWVAFISNLPGVKLTNFEDIAYKCDDGEWKFAEYEMNGEFVLNHEGVYHTMEEEYFVCEAVSEKHYRCNTAAPFSCKNTVEFEITDESVAFMNLIRVSSPDLIEI